MLQHERYCPGSQGSLSEAARHDETVGARAAKAAQPVSEVSESITDLSAKQLKALLELDTADLVTLASEIAQELGARAEAASEKEETGEAE